METLPTKTFHIPDRAVAVKCPCGEFMKLDYTKAVIQITLTTKFYIFTHVCGQEFRRQVPDGVDTAHSKSFKNECKEAGCTNQKQNGSSRCEKCSLLNKEK